MNIETFQIKKRKVVNFAAQQLEQGLFEHKAQHMMLQCTAFKVDRRFLEQRNLICITLARVVVLKIVLGEDSIPPLLLVKVLDQQV